MAGRSRWSAVRPGWPARRAASATVPARSSTRPWFTGKPVTQGEGSDHSSARPAPNPESATSPGFFYSSGRPMHLKAVSFVLSALVLVLGSNPSLAAEKTKPVAPPSAASQAKASPSATKINLVDINSATRSELKQLPGITEADAAKIIAGRPYGSKAQLVSHNIISGCRVPESQDADRREAIPRPSMVLRAARRHQPTGSRYRERTTASPMPHASWPRAQDASFQVSAAIPERACGSMQTMWRLIWSKGISCKCMRIFGTEAALSS